ncbi:MAG: type II toxin-antitoxin system VapC family toxin [Candidatus Peregrinibacteria bacterium]|nr:type II toxin-antitoxin system VapC family toxin [Candidatus Peregrinibacteria bacterium]MDZ4244959.1 type II toxin-antitoxin system VapC family toxin [Candidatus Gracilibacteria bacterium]
MFLIDSNIIIYLISNNKKIIKQMEKFEGKPCLISAISRLEVLFGVAKHNQPVERTIRMIDKYPALPIYNETVDKAFNMRHQDKVSLKFKDLLIAGTAIEHKFTLITADKEFKKVKNLQVELLKI